jgi:hypothetical protein
MEWGYLECIANATRLGLKCDTVQTRSETDDRSVLKRVTSDAVLQLRNATRFHHFAI